MKPFDVESLRRFAVEFDARLAARLADRDDTPHDLAEAVRYSVLAPGKRLRPFLVTRCCALVGGDPDSARPAALAVECVHAFSLIHDDLPAMDDADLRRGRATCHKRFGEAMAVLAGDALLALAFELLARDPLDPPRVAAMVSELAHGTGGAGMIGGQVLDIRGEGRAPTLDSVRAIHDGKTARLFETACRLGAIAGAAATTQRDRLGRFGLGLGRAFQIADDLLDLSGDPDAGGKTTGVDARAHKQTYPACVGVEESYRAADRAVECAVAELEPFGDAAEDLRSLVRYVAAREN
jgi:geranylgeranyl pyrophosphate synthase